jgi:hypothetical protein
MTTENSGGVVGSHLPNGSSENDDIHHRTMLPVSSELTRRIFARFNTQARTKQPYTGADEATVHRPINISSIRVQFTLQE